MGWVRNKLVKALQKIETDEIALIAEQEDIDRRSATLASQKADIEAAMLVIPE